MATWHYAKTKGIVAPVMMLGGAVKQSGAGSSYALGTVAPPLAAVARQEGAQPLIKRAQSLILSQRLEFVLIEFACSPTSTLGSNVPECALAVLITATEDLTLPSTKAALHGLILV